MASIFSSPPPLDSEVESQTSVNVGSSGGGTTAGAKNICLSLSLARYKWRFVAIIEFDLFVERHLLCTQVESGLLMSSGGEGGKEGGKKKEKREASMFRAAESGANCRCRGVISEDLTLS